MGRQELVLDSGVLESAPVLELQGALAVAAHGGCALVPWRRDWQAARAAGFRAVAVENELGEELFTQAVVHLQKSRDGTWCDLGTAWRHLELGGSLLFCGFNPLGVRTAIKRLAAELGQAPEIVANRAHGRVARFVRDRGSGPKPPANARVALPGYIVGEIEGRGTGASPPFLLHSAPGVFSSAQLDPGTELLLASLTRKEPGGPSPRRVFDPGCGIGPLGLSALLVWSDCRVVMADADARAVSCARQNVTAAGLAERGRVVWWDASEDPPVARCDRVLLNPPFHRGKKRDLNPARQLFRAAADALRSGGSALVVANQALPYEAELSLYGRVSELVRRAGYKVLEMIRG